MYDIIGDIHGHADKLEALLSKMGYQEIKGVYRHPERTLVSVGDLIDRGPEQRRSVEIIKRMCEADSAICIMGNHEFNAVAWATEDEEGNHLREHSDKNFKQHREFLGEAMQDTGWYTDTIEWFKTLPLYLELPDLRVVHACWHEPSLSVLDDFSSDGVLHSDVWGAATTEGHRLYDAIEVLCKGWEVPLPPGYSFLDKDDNPRTKIRTKWWREDDRSYKALAIGVKDPSTLPMDEVPGNSMPGYDNQKPLFIGHYWMRGRPCLQSESIACVDWSVADNGAMVGYRLDGSRLCDSKFYSV
ncbi:MAG: metallophosphoesterase [Idiomarinaceae bacterium]|nr:metallophosphoesterase [Idiomarinaceae bacterium]|tara:strand:+ start:7449 stop:8348 length:900 start_codon:yes stop_codon:yes gene_type:complete